MNIYSLVKDALTLLNIPISANIYIAQNKDDIPDTIIGYTINSSPKQFANNLEFLREYQIQVVFYSRQGLLSMPDIEGVMKAAGFTFIKNEELPYEDDTRHFGMTFEFNYLEERI